jgi:hypothetical protein
MHLSGAVMFEIVICCVIVFAVGYWATLWAAGRREDVLHGQFVELQGQPDAAPATMPTPPPRVASRPLLPLRPPVKAQPLMKAQPPANANAKRADAEELKSLLISLKQELKNAAKL